MKRAPETTSSAAPVFLLAVAVALFVGAAGVASAWKIVAPLLPDRSRVPIQLRVDSSRWTRPPVYRLGRDYPWVLAFSGMTSDGRLVSGRQETSHDVLLARFRPGAVVTGSIAADGSDPRLFEHEPPDGNDVLAASLTLPAALLLAAGGVLLSLGPSRRSATTRGPGRRVAVAVMLALAAWPLVLAGVASRTMVGITFVDLLCLLGSVGAAGGLVALAASVVRHTRAEDDNALGDWQVETAARSAPGRLTL